ncbi:hypothetical protein DYQ86_27055 [Acidobacteria bacterium AB60]|nr:hypothetical protein DYQ86_27055 [Acidobacteria bacterium AB60]
MAQSRRHTVDEFPGPLSIKTVTRGRVVGRKVGDEEVVFSVDHVQAAFEALSRAGIVFERKPHELAENAWAASFRDPDGHVLSVYGAK